MNIRIRNAEEEDYTAAESMMRQVHQMHADWRPDIFRYHEPVLPQELFEQAVKEKTFFLAEYEGADSRYFIHPVPSHRRPGSCHKKYYFCGYDGGR